MHKQIFVQKAILCDVLDSTGLFSIQYTKSLLHKRRVNINLSPNLVLFVNFYLKHPFTLTAYTLHQTH